MSGSGTHVFRSTVTLSYSINNRWYQKILKMDGKVFFINTGNLVQTGWILTVNSSNYTVMDVLKLDGGTNNLGYGKCSVQTLNGGLYFHL